MERKSRTSAAVKNRYVAKTYDRISVLVPKAKAAAYKAACKEMGIPYSDPLHRAIDDLLRETI